MAYHKKYDLACKVGTYEKNGETKNRYKNVGLILESEEVGENGKPKRIVMIDPTFNFAAVKREDGKDMVMVSMFEPKDKQEQQTTTQEE